MEPPSPGAIGSHIPADGGILQQRPAASSVVSAEAALSVIAQTIEETKNTILLGIESGSVDGSQAIATADSEALAVELMMTKFPVHIGKHVDQNV